jgi:hypothetical protein
MNLIKLFFTGFLQVSLVTAQTYLITIGNVIGIATIGFSISWIWWGNAKRASIGGMVERFIYASGASSGAVVGFLLAKLVTK